MIIEVIIGAGALVISYLTYVNKYHSKYKEERTHLLIHFKATQTLSKEVQKLLNQYVVKYGAFNHDMYPGVSYSTAIKTMQEQHKVNLNDSFINMILNQKMPKQTIETLTKSVEGQYQALQQIKNEMLVKLI